MAFTKIQPQQLQLPTFTSPSGDFTFTDLSTGIQINLDRDIVGPMIISDLATSAESTILTVPNNNSFSNDSICLAGENNTVSGVNNVLLNGKSITDFSGSFNTLVNGESVGFGASGQKNTILGGNGVSFDDQVTGSVILADHETAVTNSTNHSLLVSFGSGVNFQNGDVQFNGDDTYFNSHLNVNSTHSGIFSGSVGIESSLKVGGYAEFVTSAEFQGSVVLNDNSEAASQTWVDETGVRMSMYGPGSPAPLGTYLNSVVGNSFGTNSFNKLPANDMTTGYMLVDTVSNPDRAKLVFTTNGFTGVINFDDFQTGHV